MVSGPPNALKCLLIAVGLALAAPVLAISCADWNTKRFFEQATAAEVRGCLDAGGRVEARAGRGWTPLHSAAGWSDNPAVITALVEAGARVNARSRYDRTPLHSAAEYSDNPAVITALTAAGGRVEARDEYGTTPLHQAAKYSDNPATVMALLDAGADATARDLYDKIPWDYAQENEALRGTDAYWRLNDARFR